MADGIVVFGSFKVRWATARVPGMTRAEFLDWKSRIRRSGCSSVCFLIAADATVGFNFNDGCCYASAEKCIDNLM